MARLTGWLARLGAPLIGAGPYRIEPCPLCGGDVITEPTAKSWNAHTFFSVQRPARQVIRACAVDGRAPYNDASKALAPGADPDELLGRWTR